MASGLGSSDDPGVGFTMDDVMTKIDTVQTVEVVPAAELGETTQLLAADIQVTIIGDLRHVVYDQMVGRAGVCLGGEGLEADVVVQIDLETWLHAEVETTLAALGTDFSSIWFGSTEDGLSLDTLVLDPTVEAAILAYDPLGCGVAPALIAGRLHAHLSPEMLEVETERCDRVWSDYTVSPPK